jgi:hypothetical protein
MARLYLDERVVGGRRRGNVQSMLHSEERRRFQCEMQRMNGALGDVFANVRRTVWMLVVLGSLK